ncbi:hypothetical protein EV385_5706 [Krasilnikovia cinnamomea]|uniref:Uncharacterized protein n=1 Tax=Krasilnikovia cinnamomea TaxID=349313 RepID=A0A4Q7ZRJ8_9ACTN|nr:hypothetical protein [Krasilnikovia cinnamomea]RZU53772.1 hypothetical protein EV385_5706 [Krasilnikovia cinnamomea]
MPHPIPSRPDGWQPKNVVVEALVAHYRGAASRTGPAEGGGELAALAGMALVLGVGLLQMTGSVLTAVLIPLVTAGTGALVVIGTAKPAAPPPGVDVFAARGGAGSLPAGYLVSPDVWDLGMAQRTVDVPAPQLQAAAQLCREFPGSVNRLLDMVATIDAQRDAQTVTDEDRTRRIVREVSVASQRARAPKPTDLLAFGPQPAAFVQSGGKPAEARTRG